MPLEGRSLKTKNAKFKQDINLVLLYQRLAARFPNPGGRFAGMRCPVLPKELQVQHPVTYLNGRMEPQNCGGQAQDLGIQKAARLLTWRSCCFIATNGISDATITGKTQNLLIYQKILPFRLE